MRITLRWLSPLAVSSLLFACGGPLDVSESVVALQRHDGASKYEPDVLINMEVDKKWTARCTGTLIDARVVLTAAHCIAGWTAKRKLAPEVDFDTPPDKVRYLEPEATAGVRYQILAPYLAQEAGSVAERITTTVRFLPRAKLAEPDHENPDVAVLIIDGCKGFDIATPAKIGAPIETTKDAEVHGRVDKGAISSTDVYVAKKTALVLDKNSKNYYASPVNIDGGDSGGGVHLSGVIAVNAHAEDQVGGRVDRHYRVDSAGASGWITAQIPAPKVGEKNGDGEGCGEAGDCGACAPEEEATVELEATFFDHELRR